MKNIFCILLILGTFPLKAIEESSAIIIDNDSKLERFEGSKENFTGEAHVKYLFKAHAPARTSAGEVQFEKGARTNWHTHPFGQSLVVLDGEGYVQEWGKERKIIKKGDVVWIPKNTKHWHGASENSSMTHLAIQEQDENGTVKWLEKVSDEQYYLKNSNISLKKINLTDKN